MAERHVDRKLTAILAADVAGYSRLMEASERATIATLDACRAVFQDGVAGHGGRIVDTAGDSVLAVLPSAIGAFEAAREIQDELRRMNETMSEDRRMRFRIGINLGDVIEKDDGSIYGSGVNVAARLEGLADPGGICLSGSAHEQVEGKTNLGFENIGQHQVKNIARPVQAYRLVVNAQAGAVAPSTARAASERPSIAVLAFENLSGDADQEYFADGIAEDLITEISRLRWLQVAARNSSFTYKGQAVDVRQVGADLGVRYVVEGSVRKGGERVRITAQLIDTETGNHLWAERYDRDLSNIFDLQDEITETLVAALQTEVGQFERERAYRKPPENQDAWESYQRGLWHLWRINVEDFAEARRLFQSAINLDPNFAQPVAALAYTLFIQNMLLYSEFPRETLEQVSQLANKAIALDDKEAMAHFMLGRVQSFRGEYEAAIAELRTAIDLNPSLALAHYGLALTLMLAGQLDEAISEYDTAMRLSPRDPLIWAFFCFRGWARLLSGDYEAAVEDERRAIRHPAAAFYPHAILASALALLGRREEASIALDKLLEIKPDYNPEQVLAAWSPLNPEALRPLAKTFFDGLRKAGLDLPGGRSVPD